jgi:putative endonuclease
MDKQSFVYILSNDRNTVLYIGVTNNLERRYYEHKASIVKGFTHKYNVKKLVYFERFDSIDFAIAREKQIKKYSRQKKDNIINKQNPQWRDLMG